MIKNKLICIILYTILNLVLTTKLYKSVFKVKNKNQKCLDWSITVNGIFDKLYGDIGSSNEGAGEICP